MENKGGVCVLMGRFELGRLLGQGTFAKVYYARNLKTGMSVAIKIIDKEKVFKVGMMEQIKREISVMRLVKHPNVVELYEVMATKTKIYFVIEYVKGGELFNKIAKGKIKESLARKYFQQLISAVDYCHSRGVCHRDLKPENLLLDENGNLKVSDFGLSALAESKHQDGLLHTTCGTPAYVAPEVINRRGYDGAKADTWSCGVILFVLLAGYLPFHDSNLMEMYRKIGKGEYKFPNWFSQDVRRLLSKILDPNPNTRISMAKIMEKSWFRKGLVQKPAIVETEVKDPIPLNVDEVFGPNENSTTSTEPKQELKKPCNLNAFDIIAFSTGFDLSGLFEGVGQKKEVRFTSNNTSSTIISKLEDIAKNLRLKVKKKDGGLMKMEGSKEGRKGVLGIDAEIFEITPCFHLVEVKKSSGDSLEYQDVLKRDIRPALKDIVWTWQGEEQQQQAQLRPELEDETSGTSTEPNQELTKPCTFYVFEIISIMLTRFEQKKEARFTSKNTVSTIVSKIEDIAKSLGLEVKKRDRGLMRMEGSKEGRKGVLGIDAEISEFAPFIYLVEVKKSSGDSLEYEKILKRDIRPALEDIVWGWL